MMLRLVRFSFGPGKRAEAQALADELVPLIAAQPGCERVAAFGDDSDGQYGLVVFWESQATADAASRVVRPQLDKHLAGKVQAPPDIRLFEMLAQ